MSNHDRIERMLREDAAGPLPDGGFAARVMAALPPAAPRRSLWWKPALVLGSAAIGSALAVALGPSDLSLVQGFVDLAHSRIATPSALTGLAMSLTLIVCAVVLAAETD